MTNRGLWSFVLVGSAIAVNSLLTLPAQALTFFASDAKGRSASANFDSDGFNLVVTLTNTSQMDVRSSTDILTAVFFNLPENIVLTPISATLAPDSTVLFGKSNTTDVGGEWAYRAGFKPIKGAKQGISSVSLGIFKRKNLFPGPNLQGPKSPDGLQYGITSAGDDPATGRKAVRGKNALIDNSVIFTLAGLPEEFDLTGINHVSFQYGSNRYDPRISATSTSIPTPALLPGLLGFGLATWRKKQMVLPAGVCLVDSKVPTY